MAAWKLSAAGLEFLCHFEGFRAKPYQDSGGVWTIGYGTTLPHDVLQQKYKDGISQDQAKTLVLNRVDIFCGQLAQILPSNWMQHHMDAVIALSYNIGIEGFKGSTIHKQLMARSPDLSSWRYWIRDAHNKILGGLVVRRDREVRLFIYGEYDTSTSPYHNNIIA